MPRGKSTSVRPADQNTSADLMKSAARAKRRLETLGADNAVSAIKLTGAGSAFKNVYVAIGFFANLASKQLSRREELAYEERGRDILAALGVEEEVVSSVGDCSEVLVRVPITHLNDLDALYAMGLRRTASSFKRGFAELRGAADLEKLKPLVASLGGTLTVVDRPLPPQTDVPARAETAQADQDKVAETASASAAKSGEQISPAARPVNVSAEIAQNGTAESSIRTDANLNSPASAEKPGGSAPFNAVPRPQQTVPPPVGTPKTHTPDDPSKPRFMHTPPRPPVGYARPSTAPGPR